MIRCKVTFGDKTLKVKVPIDTTVAGLLIKLRKHYDIAPEVAVFMFFGYKGILGQKKERMWPGTALLSAIEEELGAIDAILLFENAFG